MKKIVYICDCCKKETNENNYFIDIYQNADRLGRLTTRGAENNISLNHNKIFGRESTYCQECIDKIKEFIRKGAKL